MVHNDLHIFKKWIEKNINKKNDMFNELNKITLVDDFSEITSFEYTHESKIKTLEGLVFFNNLTYLDLSGCESIRDISDIKHLKYLKEIKLYGCKSLESIDALSELTNLEEIDLNYCESIKNIEPITRLFNLKILRLNGMRLFNTLEKFYCLENLEELSLDNSYLLELSGVSKFKKLEKLSLACTGIEIFDEISRLTLLKKLDLTATKISNINSLRSLSNLQELNLTGCDKLVNLNGIENILSLETLVLTSCTRLTHIKPIISLKYLKDLAIRGCAFINDIHELLNMNSLENLNYDINPAIKHRILMNAAVKRKDLEWFKKNLNFFNLIEVLELISDHEPFTGEFLKCMNFINNEIQRSINSEINYLLSNSKLINVTNVIFSRDDLGEETLMNYFPTFFEILGYPKLKELLEHIFTNFSSKKEIIVKPLIYSLSELIDPEAKTWAVDYVGDLLKPYEKNKDKAKELAPTVCLFYAKMNLENKVKEWLQMATEEGNPVWRDRVLVALCSWHIAKEEYEKAKKLIREIIIPAEKDKAFEQYILGCSNKEEIGYLFDQINDNLKKMNIAEKLGNDEEYTAKPGNVYRILLALEDDKEKLAELFTKLISLHPDSEIVPVIANQFTNKTSEKTLYDRTEKFLTSEIVLEHVKKNKLKELLNDLKDHPNIMNEILNEALVQYLYKKKLIDDNERSEILSKIVIQREGTTF